MRHSDQRIDLLLLVLWPIIGFFLANFFRLGFMWGVFLYFVVPCLYLSWRAPEYFKKTALFSFIGLPTIFVLDHIAHLTNTWFIPNDLFPIRFFGTVTLEFIIWWCFNIYFVILFYEYFIGHHHRGRVWYPRLTKLFYAAISVFLVSIGLFLFDRNTLLVPYWYFVFGVLLIAIPIIFQAIKYPSIFTKIFSVVPYFAFVTLLYEITAIRLSWWSFPAEGMFVGFVSFFGQQFPFEEFFFWILLTAPAILAFYEFCDTKDERL